MGIPTTIDNPEFIEWYISENSRRDARDTETLITLILMIAQLVTYYNLWDSAVAKRDVVLDAEKDFLDYMHAKDLGVDFPMMQAKQAVLGLAVPAVTVCGDALSGVGCTSLDGKSVDSKADSMARLSCGGMPFGFVNREGALLAGRTSSYSGAILGNSSKRRSEAFQAEKTKLVLRGQATARFSHTPILNSYNQAANIQEKLASIFAQGFNSAGIGLGNALGQMTQNSSGGTGNG